MVTQNPVRTTRPAASAPAQGPPRGVSRGWPDWDAGRWRLTLACALATLASSLALSPLLDGGWWLVPTAVVVTVVSGAGGLARTLRAPAPAQPLISAAALLTALTVLFAHAEAVLGFIPGPAAIRRLQELALQGRAFIEASVPPAGEDVGLLLLVAGGIGLTVLVVDTLACALDLPGATLVPLSGLFLVPWVIGHGSAPAWTFLVVALAWIGILATAQGDWARRWAPTARPGRLAVGVVTTGAVALAALVGGTIAAGREPIFTLGSGLDIGQGGGTLQIDELVSLRRSLVDNDDRQVLAFTATTTQVDYLRLAVLDRFDGERWSRAPRTRLDASPPPWWQARRPTIDLVQYDLRVGPLGGATLPTPSGTVDVRSSWPVVWDQRSALPSRSDGRGIKGQQIGLTVWPTPWNADTLRAASIQDGTFDGIYQSDIADPTPLVGTQLRDLAADVTQDAATPYDQGVALQNWFTISGGFTYSTSVPGGSTGTALEIFLRERVGYCEQFAATMALMARTLGIPARVVVGFTAGRQEGDQWVVRGTDAHAWPELWMGTAGWVRFEPTPGAPTVRAPSYTRPVSSGLPAGIPTAAASPGADGQDDAAEGRLPESSNDAVSSAGGASRIPWRLMTALAALVLLLLIPGLVRAVRRRQRLGGGSEEAYREVVDTARDHGLLPAEESTARGTLGRIAAGLRVPDEMLTAAIRASAAGGARDPRAAIQAIQPRTLPGLETSSEADEQQIAVAVALGRICAAVERNRYARQADEVLVAAGGSDRPDSAPGSGPALDVAGPRVRSVLAGAAEPRSDSARGGAEPGADSPADSLDAQVQVVRAAVQAASPRWRRVLARVAPASLLPARAGLPD